MKLENYVLSSLKEFVKKDNDTLKKYIDERELLKQGFNDMEIFFAKKILQKHGIELKKEMITKEDRTFLVRDRNTNDIIPDRDKSEIANIEYDEDGNVIFEDYSKLDEYLEKQFIPKYIQNKVSVDKNTKQRISYKSIQLNHIIGLRLSEIENVYIFQYLNDKDIRIGGMSPDIEDGLLNYDYISTYKNIPLPVFKGEQNTNELFSIFSKTTDKVEKNKIRNKIIEENLRLSNWVAYKYAIITGESIDELNQNAALGLIEAVNSFDINKGTHFSSYAVVAIRRSIVKELAKKDNMNSKLYNSILWLKCAIKRENPDLSEKELIEKALEQYIDMENTSSSLKYKAYSNFLYPEIIRKNYEDEKQQDKLDEVLDIEYNKKLNDLIKETLNTLTLREQSVLLYRYGFIDGIGKSLDQTAIYFKATREKIRSIEVQALKKMRHPSIARRLEKFINYDVGASTIIESRITSEKNLNIEQQKIVVNELAEKMKKNLDSHDEFENLNNNDSISKKVL